MINLNEKRSSAMAMKLLRPILLALALWSAAPAWAVLPDEMLSDPALEARARALSKELRCMVCQNQSIDDSAAPLAHQDAQVARERLTAGDRIASQSTTATRQRHFIWAYSAGESAGLLRAGFGAPTRKRRSESDSAPPITITTAPNQMSSTNGL